MTATQFAGFLKGHRAVRPLLPALRTVLAKVSQTRTPSLLRKIDRLHLGAGGRQIPGWGNIDVHGRKNIIWDLRRPLPLRPGTIRFIYTEHFIEHVTRDDAVSLLKSCRNALMRGGVMRISTPNLRRIVTDYLDGALIHLPQYDWHPETTCIALNGAMRDWGHLFIYDSAELVTTLQEAGFTNIRPMPWGESSYPELVGLETRPYFDDLIFEAS